MELSINVAEKDGIVVQKLKEKMAIKMICPLDGLKILMIDTNKGGLCSKTICELLLMPAISKTEFSG